MIYGIIIAVCSGIILLLIEYYWKIVFNKPILKIKYICYSQSSEASNKRDFLLFKWRRSFKFENNSKHDAKNLEIIWPFNLSHIDLSFEPRSFLKAYGEIEEKVTVEKYVSYKDLENHKRDRFEYFLPEELQKIYFILKYENEHGKNFYIRYKKKRGQEIIDEKPKIIKPKFKKDFRI